MGMLSMESVIDSHRDACSSFMLPYMTHVQGGVVTISCTGGPFAVILTVLGDRRGPLCLQSSCCFASASQYTCDKEASALVWLYR